MRKKSTRAKKEILPEGKINAPVLSHMRAVAFNPSTPRMILNRLDKLHDDDAAEAAAKAKRERKAEKVRARLAK